MKREEAILARKYAAAFLNQNVHKITHHDYQNIIRAYAFLKKVPMLKTYLKLPILNEVKKKFLILFCQEFQLDPVCTMLVDLLVKHQRLYLIEMIFFYIKNLYQEQNNIMEFTFISANQITTDQCSKIQSFLIQKTGKTIEYKSIVDPQLIAGIRAQSNTLLWENSIQGRMNEAYRLLKKQGTHYGT